MTSLIDYEGINTVALSSARSLLPNLIPGGTFRSLEYVAKNPRRNDQRPGSFLVNYKTGKWKDFASGDGGSDLISLMAYVRGSGQGEAARELADKLGVPALKSNGAAMSKPNGVNGHHASPSPGKAEPSTLAAPKVFPWGDGGPLSQANEIRRHAYLDGNGTAVRIKIKYADGRYIQWFRAAGGWQAKKPDDFQPAPYVTEALNPFDSELKNDEILWPEGEKDVDTLNKLNLPAFTFGGVGDGLPSGIDKYLAGRNLVILADNDDPGREHAEKKAVRAHAAGAASIKIVEFPELTLKCDVSDFVAAGGTADQLNDRASAAALWKSSDSAAQNASPMPSSDSAECKLVVRCMADVEPEKIEWLWPGRIAIGKQTLIGGEPGLGKSQITTALAATVTNGGTWPCGEGKAPLGNVIILSAEDDAGDTIRPRLDAAGADVTRVHQISAVQGNGKGRRTFNLQADLALLEDEIKSIGDVRLVIIDPVSSYLGKTDSHKNAEVRGTLEPLGDMASRLRVAVISVTHFSKGAGQSAVNSFIGSIAFIAAARAAFIVTRDPDNDDPARRLFVQAKNNLAIDSGGLACRVEQRIVGQDIVASAIIWESERISRTADEILAASRGNSERPERSEAEDFLRDVLSGGPQLATEIKSQATAACLAWRTVNRAKHDLGVTATAKADPSPEPGKPPRVQWWWSLPIEPQSPRMPPNAQECHVSDVASLGNVGILGGIGGGR